MLPCVSTKPTHVLESICFITALGTKLYVRELKFFYVIVVVRLMQFVMDAIRAVVSIRAPPVSPLARRWSTPTIVAILGNKYEREPSP